MLAVMVEQTPSPRPRVVTKPDGGVYTDDEGGLLTGKSYCAHTLTADSKS